MTGGEAEEAWERSDLTSWLLDQGFTVEQIRAAGAASFMLPAKRAMRDGDEYVSARDVADSTGLTLDLVQRLQAVIDLPRGDNPEAATVLRADADVLSEASLLVELGLDADETVVAMRIIADALGRAASIVREAASRSLSRVGGGDIDMAKAIEQLARRSGPRLGPMMENLLLLKLRHSFEAELFTAAERATEKVPGTQEITVAFADVAGFTEIGASHPPQELQRLAGLLVRLAIGVAVPPVRLVKSIGDAVMLISTDPVALLIAMIQLSEATGEDSQLPVRIGVASGLAITRIGDWFGHAVNVASRVTAAGQPGMVLVAESTRSQATHASGLVWSRAAHHSLKGIRDDIQLYWVQRHPG